ncbi:metal-dependent hydrolase [Elizabethkingia miricola]|nr:metal-dependent hydrolase [Elizabethkingia miricola]
MKARLIRNATLWLEIEGINVLVDPMLGKKGSLGPFPWTEDKRANPLSDLPFNHEELSAIIQNTNLVLLTHLHPDHWDDAAQKLLPKDILIYCQPNDEEQIRNSGFTHVIPVKDEILYKDISIMRTGGKHGLGKIGELMGEVSGYMLKTEKESLYITGDTIWCEEVSSALTLYNPEYIIANGGGARFSIGEHVTMNGTDIQTLAAYADSARIAVVHLETVSPVQEDRESLKKFFSQHKTKQDIIIPDDGAFIFD